MVLNFTSLNLSSPLVGQQLSALGTAINISIAAPGSHYSAATSRIYLDSAQLSAFNSNANNNFD